MWYFIERVNDDRIEKRFTIVVFSEEGHPDIEWNSGHYEEITISVLTSTGLKKKLCYWHSNFRPYAQEEEKRAWQEWRAVSPRAKHGPTKIILRHKDTNPGATVPLV